MPTWLFDDLTFTYSILEMFPTELVKTVREWERRTGASIYVVTTYKKPGGRPEVFE